MSLNGTIFGIMPRLRGGPCNAAQTWRRGSPKQYAMADGAGSEDQGSNRMIAARSALQRQRASPETTVAHRRRTATSTLLRAVPAWVEALHRLDDLSRGE